MINKYATDIKKSPPEKGSELLRYESVLFSFVAVTAGATLRIAGAGIPHVNFGKRAEAPRMVKSTFRHAATDTAVDFLIFVHHTKNLLFPPF